MRDYTLTTYNIFKLQLPRSRQVLGTLCAKNDFVLIQEWVSSLHIKDGEYFACCPTFVIPLRKIKTGTAIISKHKITDSVGLVSREKELGFLTRKSMLITAYTLHDGTTLHIANIHALNFVSNATWKEHLNYFIDYLPKSGPLIFAGDFNTWNPARFDYLEQVLKKNHLHYANYEHNIVMRLDHIFTRGITIKKTEAHTNVHSSDHYPITLTFSIT